jgi:hypothetical protein
MGNLFMSLEILHLPNSFAGFDPALELPSDWYLIPCQNLQISGTLLLPNAHMQQVPLQI